MKFDKWLDNMYKNALKNMYKNALKKFQPKIHPASYNFWHICLLAHSQVYRKSGKRLKINIYYYYYFNCVRL